MGYSGLVTQRKPYPSEARSDLTIWSRFCSVLRLANRTSLWWYVSLFLQRTLPSKKGAIKVPSPTSFQLVTNYRSHGGIVRCAHSIVEIITAFWPSAIDRLAPEEGVVDGPRPTFFYGWGSENTGHSQFFAELKLLINLKPLHFTDVIDRAPEQSEIEFGAEQCECLGVKVPMTLNQRFGAKVY